MDITKTGIIKINSCALEWHKKKHRFIKVRYFLYTHMSNNLSISFKNEIHTVMKITDYLKAFNEFNDKH